MSRRRIDSDYITCSQLKNAGTGGASPQIVPVYADVKCQLVSRCLHMSLSVITRQDVGKALTPPPTSALAGFQTNISLLDECLRPSSIHLPSDSAQENRFPPTDNSFPKVLQDICTRTMWVATVSRARTIMTNVLMFLRFDFRKK